MCWIHIVFAAIYYLLEPFLAIKAEFESYVDGLMANGTYIHQLVLANMLICFSFLLALSFLALLLLNIAQ